MKHFARKIPYKGEKYDSQKELNFFIRFIENSGKRYKIHQSFRLVDKFPVGGRNMHGLTYTPDFVVFRSDGTIQHVYDVKSGINQRGVDTAAKIRFTLFSLKTGIPVEVVVPRKYDFKMKLFGFTTTFQDQHVKHDRHGKVKTDSDGNSLYDYYNVYKDTDYDVSELIGM